MLSDEKLVRPLGDDLTLPVARVLSFVACTADQVALNVILLTTSDETGDQQVLWPDKLVLDINTHNLSCSIAVWWENFECHLTVWTSIFLPERRLLSSAVGRDASYASARRRMKLCDVRLA